MDITCRHENCACVFPTYEERTDHEIAAHFQGDVSKFM